MKPAERNGVAKPPSEGGCWAQRRAIRGQTLPEQTTCLKATRTGYLTCIHHAHREEAAGQLWLALERDK